MLEKQEGVWTAWSRPSWLRRSRGMTIMVYICWNFSPPQEPGDDAPNDFVKACAP